MNKENPKKETKTKVKTVKEKKHPILTKVILRIVTIVLTAAICFSVSFFYFKRFTTVETESKTALVDRQLSYCQELVTAKYRYSDIITLKKSSGFAKSYSIIKYTGILRAGIADFTEITYDISIDGNKITLYIPQAELLGNELVKQEVFDEKTSIFVPITTQEIFDEIAQAQTDAAEDMIADGILEEARNYTIKIISQFMYALGFEEVIIKWL